ncbi:IclR family transcriptional regulator [Nocardioides sp.]|uniref:IclR family transcriptional regulator n=1 Tax=Nocardioides sp. TaxID=35761 RepID=UPI0026023552|nr:IclR family transcriptional regulator [Nocardioides sp.]MDI6910355.1 IclR family transcriptional regulator [Nocardioides sp.]
MSTSPRNNSSSVRRALAILNVLATWNRGEGASLSDLALQVGASKSTILRLLTPLLETRLVQQRRDGSYAVGVGAVSLGGAYLNNLDLRAAARPLLAELAKVSNETVHLMVYSDAQVVYVDKISGSAPMQMASRVGDRAAVHSTASGKAILAHLPTEEFDRVVTAGLPRRTDRTIVSADKLAEDLATIRERGFSVDDIENEDGIRCLASPVFDHMDAVAAAVSVSGPADRIGDRMEELADLISSAADKISELLGARRHNRNTRLHPRPDQEKEVT